LINLQNEIIREDSFLDFKAGNIENRRC